MPSFSEAAADSKLINGAGPERGPFGITWNTIEDSRINGGATIVGYNGFWQGFFRNTVNGGVTFNNNTVVDPDGNEMQTNTFDGGPRCSGNTRAPQQGDSGGSPNHVNGSKTGQCASL